MKKTTLLALSLIAPFAFLAPAHAAGNDAAPAKSVGEKAAPAKAAAKVDLAKLLDGNIVIDSVKDGKYVGPRYVLDELKKKI